jgi:hypothetical protein
VHVLSREDADGQHLCGDLLLLVCWLSVFCSCGLCLTDRQLQHFIGGCLELGLGSQLSHTVGCHIGTQTISFARARLQQWCIVAGLVSCVVVCAWPAQHSLPAVYSLSRKSPGPPRAKHNACPGCAVLLRLAAAVPSCHKP